MKRKRMKSLVSLMKLMAVAVLAVVMAGIMGAPAKAMVAAEAFATPKNGGVSFDETTGTLTLSGNIEAQDVSAYRDNEGVKKVVALEGTKFPADSQYLFSFFKYVEVFDLSKADTSGVTDMSHMFTGCTRLKALDLSHFDTSNVTNLASMFYGIDASTLDLGSFDTSKVTDMSGMFGFCTNLEAIYVSDRWTTKKVIYGANMFENDQMLIGGNGTNYFWQAKDGLTYARIDREGKPGFLRDVTDGKSVVFDETTGILTLRGQIVKKEVRDYADNHAVKKITAAEGTRFPIFCDELFYNFSDVLTFDLANVDTSLVYNMSRMFSNCRKATSMNIRNFDGSRVEKMTETFRDCVSLTTLDLGYFDGWKVESFQGLFQNCENLRSLYLGRLNARNAFSLSYMFSGCKKLQQIDLSSLNVSRCLSMEGMFYDCKSLTSLELGRFDVRNAFNFSKMFYGCENLTSLDLSGFSAQNLSYMDQMFYGCSKLQSIYVSEDWTLGEAYLSDEKDVFTGCTVLCGGNGTAYSEGAGGVQYACVDKPGQAGYLTLSTVQKPMFTMQPNESYSTIIGKGWSIIIQTAAEGVFDKYSYKWFLYDEEAGISYTIDYALACGWLEVPSQDHYDCQAHLQIMNLSEKLDGMKVYCIAMGPGGHTRSEMATIRFEKVINWFDFELADFWRLDTMYIDMSYTVSDVMSCNLSPTIENAHYQGELIEIDRYDGNNWTALRENAAFRPGWKIRFIVRLQLEEGYEFRTGTGMINGHLGDAVKVTGGNCYLSVDYEIPMPENGIMVYDFNRQVEVPVAGNVPATDLTEEKPSVARNNKYIVTGFSWSPADAVFVAGKDYTLTLDLKAKENYGFYQENEFFLNGNKMTVLELNMGKEGTVKVAYTFHLDAPESEAVITKQPRNWYGEYGKKASFTVEAEGEDLTYCWQYKKGTADWTDYALESYDTPNFLVSFNDKNAKYLLRCKITDRYGVPTYTNEVRMMLPESNPIQITKQPKHYYNAVIGKKANFTVEAAGENLHYQWQCLKKVNWQEYDNDTSQTPKFTISVSETTLTWRFRCEITDDEGNWVYTDEVRILEEDKPYGQTGGIPVRITQQPQVWYGEYGKKASFSIAAAGSGELTYQWQYKKSGAWIDYAITTADTPNFKVTMNEKNVKWPIRCLVTDERGQTAASVEVWMKLKSEEPDPGNDPGNDPVPGPVDGPVITGQPVDWYGTFGKKATFSVIASGNGLTYQWQYKKGTTWTDYVIATANDATFLVTMNEKNVKWAFRCIITDADGKTATTNEVYLKLKGEEEPVPGPADGPVITGQPADCYGRIGKKASFSVSATGEGLTYEWQIKKSGGWTAYTLAGYDTPNFQVSINEKTLNWSYRCVIRDASGNEVVTNEVHIYEVQ